MQTVNGHYFGCPMAHEHQSPMEQSQNGSDKPEPQGDRSFDEFTFGERAQLLRYFRNHLPSEEDAQDAVQESFMRLLRYRDSDPPSAWGPLLYRIASNTVAEFFRRRTTRSHNKHVALGDELISQDPSQEELIEQEQRAALLRAAILALPSRCRQVYLLSRADKLTYPQIATRCGISVKTVEKHMVHALLLLHQQVGGKAKGASVT